MSSPKSKVANLNLFLDSNHVIRVGGRLQNSKLSIQERHPILLAPHPIVNLIIRHVHVQSLHAGVQLTLATLRQQY